MLRGPALRSGHFPARHGARSRPPRGGPARELSIADFVKGPYQNGSRAGRARHLGARAAAGPGRGVAHEKMSLHERPAVTVVWHAVHDGGWPRAGGRGICGHRAARALDAEAALAGAAAERSTAGRRRGAAAAAAEPVEDGNGSVEYKRQLVRVLRDALRADSAVTSGRAQLERRTRSRACGGGPGRACAHALDAPRRRPRPAVAVLLETRLGELGGRVSRHETPSRATARRPISGRPADRHGTDPLPLRHGVAGGHGGRTPGTAGRRRRAGPGVFDMRGGIVAALAALERATVRAGVRILLTPDEETGSRARAS